MKQHISQLALVVKDYDEALDFYINKLDFVLQEDTTLSLTKRWVVVAPPGSKECSILLAKAANNEQLKSVGNQTGGRVFLFLFTDNFWQYYNKLVARKVVFVRKPVLHAYGTVAVFKDLYGNLWDLIEPSKKNSKF